MPPRERANISSPILSLAAITTREQIALRQQSNAIGLVRANWFDCDKFSVNTPRVEIDATAGERTFRFSPAPSFSNNAFTFASALAGEFNFLLGTHWFIFGPRVWNAAVQFFTLTRCSLFPAAALCEMECGSELVPAECVSFCRAARKSAYTHSFYPLRREKERDTLEWALRRVMRREFALFQQQHLLLPFAPASAAEHGVASRWTLQSLEFQRSSLCLFLMHPLAACCARTQSYVLSGAKHTDSCKWSGRSPSCSPHFEIKP